MFAVCVNTSCNLNKSIEHEWACVCVMVLLSFDISGKSCCYSALMMAATTTTIKMAVFT